MSLSEADDRLARAERPAAEALRLPTCRLLRARGVDGPREAREAGARIAASGAREGIVAPPP